MPFLGRVHFTSTLSNCGRNPQPMAATAALRTAISAPLTRCNKPSCRLSRAQAYQRASIAPEVAPVPGESFFLKQPVAGASINSFQYLPFNTRLTGTLDGYNDPFNPKIFQFAGFSIIIGQGTAALILLK